MGNWIIIISLKRAKKSKGSKETKNIKEREREREREKACQRTTERRLFVSSHAKLGDLTDTAKTLLVVVQLSNYYYFCYYYGMKQSVSLLDDLIIN
jgi:hypothetical protein